MSCKMLFTSTRLDVRLKFFGGDLRLELAGDADYVLAGAQMQPKRIRHSHGDGVAVVRGVGLFFGRWSIHGS
ncbi:MAG: hypothetical protein R2856_01410 [Caldilineaceae bacterium]